MNSTDIKLQQITALENIAKDILELKKNLGLRRPLVIEFCGTPKAGKTTTISALNIFLKRNEFKTVVIEEMAGACPVPNKTDFFFNSWTLFSSLSDLLKQLTLGDNRTDVILIDRAIFDSMCWFQWLANNPPKNPYLSSSQFSTFSNFLIGTDLWVKHIDLVYIFKTSPSEALKREFSELLTSKPGTIMNTKVLKTYNESVDNVKRDFGKRFRKIEEYDTTKQDPNFVSYDVTHTVLSVLRDLLTEKIGYFLDTVVGRLKNGINDFELIDTRSMFFGERHIVEEEKYVQPVAIAVITDAKREHVLVFRKNENKTTKDSPEHNRMLLYLGGHLRQEDKFNENEKNIATIKRALQREIKEELNETVTVDDQQPFLIYTPVSEKSKKHLAICFVIEMDLEGRKFNPTREEFVQKSASSKSGNVVNIWTVPEFIDELESWSRVILTNVFNQQPTLF